MLNMPNKDCKEFFLCDMQHLQPFLESFSLNAALNLLESLTVLFKHQKRTPKCSQKPNLANLAQIQRVNIPAKLEICSLNNLKLVI